MFGKDIAKQGKSLQQQAASRYSTMAGELATEAGPQGKTVSNYATGIVKGGPEALKVVAPQVSYLRRQMETARQQVRDNVPRGGAQQRAQMGITAAKPGAEQRIFSDQVQAALDRLTQLSQYNTGASMQANSGVANVGANLSNLANQQDATATSGLGSIFGPIGFALSQLIGAGGGGKTTTSPMPVSLPRNSSPVYRTGI